MANVIGIAKEKMKQQLSTNGSILCNQIIKCIWLIDSLSNIIVVQLTYAGISRLNIFCIIKVSFFLFFIISIIIIILFYKQIIEGGRSNQATDYLVRLR